MHRFTLALAVSACLPVAAVAQTATQWVYTPSIGPTPTQTYLTLSHGNPQTGALQVLATCAIGANWVYADLTLAADVSGLADHATTTLQVSGNRFRADYGVIVSRTQAGVSGVRLAVPLDDPIWAALSGPLAVSYRVEGGPSDMLETQGARSPILAFLSDCENIGDLRAPPAKR